MRPPPKTPNTLYSLEATEYAQQHGKFLEFHQAAYQAFWQDRQDLGQIETLTQIATTIGLDGNDLAQNLHQGAHSQTVINQYREALQYGIKGIPTFLIGNLMFTGAHPYPIFQQAMQRYLTTQ